MTIRRDWQLKQLGIIQWTLWRPQLLQGEVVVTLPAHTNFLFVAIADHLPPPDHPLVADVVRSIPLITKQLLHITPEQLMILPKHLRFHCWWVGLTAIRNLNGISLVTPPLSVLENDAAAKRDLWRQIISIKNH
ncbi:DNA polymerase III subunit psi [Candidatus Palibaumannia cicadellinicola]|uniref:DNA polymerase III subunit psi n=1 Tax=Candidatus Palibaumannia cicadellinicola TaxID=186490 RepID=A0A088MZ04_9GAMM|nr:DNA polymerase III subunit psi [Candidatus Baumannia cicadellinicola]AIN47547.1 DNA polymerase III psi subunit [Candidatus Baumannia cicadellinicola]